MTMSTTSYPKRDDHQACCYSGPAVLSAHSIGAEVYSLLRAGCYSEATQGLVHSVFDRALNILFPGGVLVGVVTRSAGESPFNIVLRTDSSLRETGVTQGEVCTPVGNYRLDIGKTLSINALGSRVYVSEHKFTRRLLHPLGISSNVRAMKGFVCGRGRLDGLGALIDVTKRNDVGRVNFLIQGQSLRRVRELLRAIKERDTKTVEEASGDLVGMGQGLTPAMDDLLCGIMLSYYLLTENLVGGDLNWARRTNQLIISRSEERTTALSSQYLKQAAIGNGNEFSVGMVRDLATSPDLRGIEGSTARLLAIGSTSGTDAAIGILLGSELALKMLPESGNND